MTLGRLLRAIRRRLGRDRAPRAAAPAKPTPAPERAGRGLLSGRSVVVVGAGMNIGLGIARELGREEGRLLVTNSSPADLEAVLHALHSDGMEADGTVSDITSAGSDEALLAVLNARGMTPDVLVLNVGVHAGPGEPSLEVMERVFRTNVIGPLHLARRVAERMRASGEGGTIVFLSSIHQWSVRGDRVYSASKAAIGMLIRELAIEFAPFRIRVNGIAPGWVAVAPDGSPRPHPMTPLYRTSIPPAFIGKAALFLAADSLSGHTTGSLLTVDGGLSLHNYLVTPDSVSGEV